MRRWATLAVLGVAASATAQVPDVRVRVDAALTYRGEGEGPTSLRLYNTQGRYSTVGLTFFLETGFRAYVSQRLERISGDVDNDLLDEYYLEDEGIWRVGKQYLPFGSGQILRESVVAARGETNLIFEGLPVTVAVFDMGRGRQRGYVGRLGSRIGASLAIGHHIGIAGTSLTQIRFPEDAPGRGRGYRLAYGIDGYKVLGTVTLRGEALALRDGETNLDTDISLIDLSATYAPNRRQAITLGFTRGGSGFGDVVRLGASAALDDKVSIEPLVRFRSDHLFDLSVSMRFRF